MLNPSKIALSTLITIKIFIGAAVLFNACLFMSCSEEVVIINTEDFDPPRYNWRAMVINDYGFSDLWAQDTNKVFLLNHNDKSLNIISGGNIEEHYVGEYGLDKIQGLSNNEVYIFGSTWFPDNRLSIIKWNGGGFEYYHTEIILSTAKGIKGLAVNSNEIWIISLKGICKYDGNGLIYYTHPDSQLIPTSLFLYNNNKVQYIAGKYVDPENIQQCLFEFRDTGFVRIYNYIGNPNINMTYTFLNEIGGFKYGLELKQPLNTDWSICMHYFSGSSFMPYFCFNGKIHTTWATWSNNPVGFNLQSFIILVETDRNVFDTTRIGILHWNGSAVSKELQLSPRTGPFDSSILYSVNSNCYLILEPRNRIEVNCILYFGTIK